MSARGLLQAALMAQLRGAPALAGVRVFDAPPVRAALPYVQLDEPVVSDWGTKSWAGIEARLTLLVFDGGERPMRLRTLIDAADAALLALPPALGRDDVGAWRLATIVPVRSRIARADRDRWTAAGEYRARLYREP